MDKSKEYDLKTIHGVLRALADGHTLISGDSTIRVSDDGKRVEMSFSDQPTVATWEAVIESGAWKRKWQLAPKDVAAMTALELARELWGDAVVATKSTLHNDRHAWVYDPYIGSERIYATTDDELLSTLRALVRAKRAGEL